MDNNTTVNDSLSEASFTKEYHDSAADKSAISMYFKEISKYPVLGDEENKRLIKQYQETRDFNIRNKIVNHNQRMVIDIAKKINSSTAMSFLDKIQEANIIFMRYLESFDLSKNNSFSSYIYTCIKRKLGDKESENYRHIKVNRNIKNYYEKYLAYKDYYNSTYNRQPTDEEVMDYLGISKVTLKTVYNAANTLKSAVSFDSPISQDDEESSLYDIVSSNKSEIVEYQERSDEKLFLYKLKEKLDDYEYYLIYHHILYKEDINIPKTLFVSHQAVSHQIQMTLQKIKAKHILSYEASITPSELSKVDIRPIDFPKKVILVYLKKILSPDEYYFVYYSWYKKLEKSKLIELLEDRGISYQDMNSYIESIYGEILSEDESHYGNIVAKVREEYSVRQIMALDVSPDNIDYLKIESIIKDLSYEEIMDKLKNKSLSKKQNRLIEEYFDNDMEEYSPEVIDTATRNITLKQLHYTGERHLPLPKLYKVYIDNRDMFEKDYQDYLEGTLFSSITNRHTDYNHRFGDTVRTTILRLEQLYYRLDHIFLYEMSLRTMKKVMDKYDYLFKDIEKDIVRKKLYGTSINALEVNKQLMEEYGMSKTEIKNIYGHAIDKIQNLYLGLYSDMVLDNQEHYLKYINDSRFQMSDEHRKICKLRYEEKLDYKEIVKRMNLKSTQQVSNIVKRVEKSIDMQYYNVQNETIYEEDKARKLIESRYSSDPANTILTKIYIDKVPCNILYETYGKKEVINMSSLFRHHYYKTYGSHDLTIEDYEREVHAHITDTVLNEEDRRLISIIYGISSKYNEKGIRLSLDEVSKKLNIERDKLRQKLRYINITIGARKNNIMGPSLGRISREELIEFFKDKNLPLSEEEKSFLKEIKGIDTETLSIDEMMKKYSLTKSSVRRRVHMSYLSILKYQNNKRKNKALDYETDVVPLLRYFPTFEQDILTYVYRDDMTEHEVSKIYSIEVQQARNYILRAKKRLYYYIKVKHSKKFDYDYARKVIDNDNLPFYGDKNMAKAYYEKSLGDNGNLPMKRNEIIKELNISDDFKTHNLFKSLMISVLMYKDGYRKIKTFTKEEVQEYYKKNKDKYGVVQQRIFEKQIKWCNRHPSNIKELNRFIVMEMLKDKGIAQFDLDQIPEDKRVNFIKVNPYNLTKIQLEMIRRYYKIPKRFFMNGENKRKLYKFLSKSLVHTHNNDDRRPKTLAISSS